MKKVLIAILSLYQKAISPDRGIIPRIFGRSKPTCIFYPSCSEYTKQAIEKYGAGKGVILGAKRLARCNPFNEPRVDLVP